MALIECKPITERKRCPFYGFYMSPIGNILIDSKGNQCALIIRSYSPCKMETLEQTIDWNKCLLNNIKYASVIENIKNTYRIAPKEFPEGISLKEWISHVMTL